MSKTAKILIGLLFALVILAIVAVIGIAYFAGSIGSPSVAQNSVLVINLAGEMPDSAPDDPIGEALGVVQPQSFTSVLTQLRKAKVDTRIGGVMLNVNFPGIGWAKADELRDAIIDVRSAGKPVYAYMEMGMNKEYYIATAADKVYLPPAGDLYINGLAAEAMFYKGALDKVGVEMEFIQIGPKYKNAPDQYTKKEMGEGQKEVINAVLDEYFGRIVKGIAERRNKSEEDVRAIIDDAPYNAKQALELKLIDGTMVRDQVYQEFAKQLGYKEDEKLRTIGASSYREVPSDTLGLNNGEKVAVIYASGAITTGRTSNSPFGGEMVGSDTVVKAVNQAAEDESIKAIVLRVDSPGGSALASDIMWIAIENAKAKKPVVVSMGDAAASGGYYISCNANKIVAQPTTLTGSIGVFMGKPNVKGLYDWLGITNEYTMRGKNSGIFRETQNWTPEERAKMEQQTNSIYFDNFVPKVAAGRNKTIEEVNTLGQGRVWTGTQAKQNGLVDEIGGLEKAIEIAKQLANLPADKDVRRIVLPAQKTFLETLFDSPEEGKTREQAAQEALAKSLPADVRRTLKYTEMFDRMKRGEAMLLSPFELTIK